jgi:hypothetical protein
VQQAFGTVLWVVCGVVAVVAFVLFVGSGKALEEYRTRGLTMDRDAPRGPPPGSAAATAERDAEIREMLNARNQRRIRRGETPIDIEQELARLTGQTPRRFAEGETRTGAEGATATSAEVGPELREEIRQLVVARNHRRARAGKPPLDVEAEIAREIRDLGSGFR